MNMADDYCRMKQQAEEATRKYEQQEAEFYNMKREMVNMQMTIASFKKAAAGEAQDTGSMSISAVVSKRGRGKKYTDRAGITRGKNNIRRMDHSQTAQRHTRKN